MDIAVIIILAFIGLAIVLAFFVMIKSKKRGLTASQQSYIKNHWTNIYSSIESNPSLSIINADKLLNYALKARGVEGSVGEQLKAASSLFSDLNGIWTAHKVRNQIAHEIGKEITPSQAKNNLNIYKKALKDLGAKF